MTTGALQLPSPTYLTPPHLYPFGPYTPRPLLPFLCCPTLTFAVILLPLLTIHDWLALSKAVWDLLLMIMHGGFLTRSQKSFTWPGAASWRARLGTPHQLWEQEEREGQLRQCSTGQQGPQNAGWLGCCSGFLSCCQAGWGQLWLLPAGLGCAVAAVALHCRVGLSFALWLSAFGSLRAAACQEAPELQCGKHPQSCMLAALQDSV